MNKHTLTLMGGSGDELRLPASTFQEIVRLLIEGARGAVRLEIEGESARPGQRPGWLDELCAFDIRGLAAGSAIVELEAPSFADLPGAALVGYDLVPDDQSAIDRFASILDAIVSGDDDVMADRSLLDTCASFARVSGLGFEGVRLDGAHARALSATVRPADAARIEALRDRTPSSRAVRLTGRLDTISSTRADVVLLLADGSRLPARLDQHDPKTLGSLFGKEVTVSGTLHFNPTGRPRHVAAETIDLASDADRVFRRSPEARERQRLFAEVPQDESSGVNSFFGTWPGEESGEELLEGLRALR